MLEILKFWKESWGVAWQWNFNVNYYRAQNIRLLNLKDLYLYFIQQHHIIDVWNNIFIFLFFEYTFFSFLFTFYHIIFSCSFYYTFLSSLSRLFCLFYRVLFNFVLSIVSFFCSFYPVLSILSILSFSFYFVQI